jgi:beta-phosphoglucomutase-like phosphatase (HAD superfamily)
VDATRSARQEHAGLLAAVDRKRVSLGLRRVADLRAEGSEPATLLKQQKDDTVTRLAVAAKPCPNVIPALEQLKSTGIPFNIATTSGKPRVPVCVDTAGMRSFFPSDELSIHSGESDFEPPRFKPAPDVYLRAASYVKLAPNMCIAVEDSASGVGSASNAGMGLIVGYVGASHIAPELKESHAQMLMKGTRADNGRGADIVIEDMGDLPRVVQHFSGLVKAGQRIDGQSRLPLTRADLPNLSGKAHFVN